jgi:hypothetical protein
MQKKLLKPTTNSFGELLTLTLNEERTYYTRTQNFNKVFICFSDRFYKSSDVQR